MELSQLRTFQRTSETSFSLCWRGGKFERPFVTSRAYVCVCEVCERVCACVERVCACVCVSSQGAKCHGQTSRQHTRMYFKIMLWSLAALFKLSVRFILRLFCIFLQRRGLTSLPPLGNVPNDFKDWRIMPRGNVLYDEAMENLPLFIMLLWETVYLCRFCVTYVQFSPPPPPPPRKTSRKFNFVMWCHVDGTEP